MRSDRDALLAAITEHAIVHQNVTLSSGKQADHYVDLRRITFSSVAPLVGRQLRELTADLDYDAVGGPTMGADPVAMAVLFAAAAEAEPVRLDAFAVRKEGKSHGLQRQVEGPDIAGRRVLAVEDTSTTGGSVLDAVKVMQAAGAEVVAVAVIADRDTGARELIEGAGLPYRALYGLEDLGLTAQRVSD